MKKVIRNFLIFMLCGVLMMGTFPFVSQAADVPSMVTVSTTAKQQLNSTREVLKLVNEERAKKGLKPYVMDKNMEQAAIQRAYELVAYCTHERPDGDMFSTVFKEYGISIDLWMGDRVGENIATGQKDAQSVMNSWMNSGDHKAQILSKYYTVIGIGCVEYDGTRYWVQLFSNTLDSAVPAPEQGSDGLEVTKTYRVDVENLVKHPDFNTTNIAFSEPNVQVKPGESTPFDLRLSAPELIWGVDREVGDILASSLTPEQIKVSDGAPFTIDDTGIHVKDDAQTGTYTITVTLGRLSAVKQVSVAICSHPEDHRKTEEKAPSCLEEGYKRIVCTECGQVISEETLPKLPHEASSDWETVKEPTCVEEGQKVRRCIHCDAIVEEQSIPSTGEHLWDNGTVKNEATCTEAGTLEYTCTVCGTTRSEPIAALGHDWSEWQTVKDATWDEEGLEQRSCQRCAVTEDNVIPALSDGHTHDFSGKETIQKEPTCTESGSKTIACTNPNCHAVKEVVIPALGHHAGDWTVIQQATCAQTGLRVKTCTVCKQELEREILPKTDDHLWDNGSVSKPATCTEAGETVFTCERCGKTRTEEIEALGHEPTEALVQEATCTQEGMKEVRCSRCELLLSTEVLPALGHNWSEWTVLKEATWDTDGLQTRNCQRCEKTEEQIIPKLSESHKHSFTGQEVILTEPTCTKEGEKQVYCSNPNCHEFIMETIPAAGHEAGEWTVLKEATCTNRGLEVKTCTVCGDSLEQRAIPALGHQYGEWEITKPATETEQGERQRICGVCGEKEIEVLAATGTPEPPAKDPGNEKSQQEPAVDTDDDLMPVVFCLAWIIASAVAGSAYLLKKKLSE